MKIICINKILIIQEMLKCLFMIIFIYLIKTSEDIANTNKIQRLKRKIFQFPTKQKNQFKKKPLTTIDKHLQSEFFSTNMPRDVFSMYNDSPLDLSTAKQYELNIEDSQNDHIQKGEKIIINTNSENCEKLDITSGQEFPYQKNSISKNQPTSIKSAIIPQWCQYSLNDERMRNYNEQIRQEIGTADNLTHDSYSSLNNIDCSSEYSNYHIMNQYKPHINGLIYFPNNGEFLQNEVDNTFQNEQSESNSVQKNEQSMILTKLILPADQKTIEDNHQKFICKICSIYTSYQIKSIENDLPILFPILNEVLTKEIDDTESTLEEIVLEKQKKTVFSKTMNFAEKIMHFCPFCSDHFIHEDEYNNIEEKFISDLPSCKMKNQLVDLLRQLFKLISDSFSESFAPKNIFSFDFFRPHRFILKEILYIFGTNKIFLGQEKRLRYLHIEYHKLFLNDIEMKLRFLPELQSIVYMLFRTSPSEYISCHNQNFMILFYSFYSLNKFFHWISKFYLQSIKFLDKSDNSVTRLIFESISFILRISFIEPLCSEFKTIQKNAQLKYHILTLNIFRYELCIFTSTKGTDDFIITNCKNLIPVIILMNKNALGRQFIYNIEYHIDKIIKQNQSNLKDFKIFLDAIKNINHSSSQD